MEKNVLLGHSRTNAEADGGQQASATESKQLDTPNKCRIIQNSPCLKPYKIQVQQKTTACDKYLSSQFVAQIFEYGNCGVVLCSVMQQGVTSVDCWISITVSVGAVSLPENS
jgi:hypothetical protein